jgi:hypothetical protein
MRVSRQARESSVATSLTVADQAAEPRPTVVQRYSREFAAALLDVAFLTGFWLLFFWPVLVRRDHLIPYDLLDQHYMFQDFIHQAMRSGQSTWWAPNILSGYPMIADPLSALFYPPNLLMHWLVLETHLPYLAMEWQLALHYLWAAVGTYLLARSLTGSRAGAVLAALTFAFGAFFAWHTPHLSPVSALSWLPWILVAYRQAVCRRSLLWTGLAAVAFGLMALAGHALTSVQIGYLLVGLTLLLTVKQWLSDRRGAVVTALIGVTVLGAGAALSMVQLLPSWQLSGLTERANFTFEAATLSSYMPHWALTAFLPNFFALDGPAPYWAPGDPAETSLYAGLLPLFLGALGVMYAKPGDRRITGFLLAGVLLSLALAFGSQTWLYHVVYDLLPGFDHVRRPGNFTVFVQFGLGLLAAYGVKVLGARDESGLAGHRAVIGWLRWALLLDLVVLALTAVALANSVGGSNQQVLMTVINGVVLAGVILLSAFVVLRGWLHWHLPARVALILLVGIAAIDLGSAGAGKVDKTFNWLPGSYIGATWARDPSDPVVPRLLDEQRKALPDRFRFVPHQTGPIWDNGPLYWGLESVRGYSVLWPSSYQRLFNAAVADPNGPLYDLLNVRYLLAPDAIEKAYPEASSEKFRLIQDGNPRIYENRDAGPRVWVAYQAVSQPEDAVLPYMQANAASLKETVVLDEPLPADAGSHAGQGGTAEIVRYENARVTIHASLPSPGFVVLADTYYPGWEAWIDGAPAHLYRADSAFRAVWVPAGEHELEYRFTFPILRSGAIVSVAALGAVLVLILAGLALHWRRRGLATN